MKQPVLAGLLAVGLVGYLTINYFNNKHNREALAQHGISLMAVVEYKSVAKGTATLSVLFNYHNRLLRNECRTPNYAYRPGDSVRIKILPQDPAGPCVIQE